MISKKSNVDYVLDKLFPSINIVYTIPNADYNINAFKQRSAIFYGAAGTGKTTLMRWFAQKMFERYFERVGCRASYTQGDLGKLFNDGWGYYGEKVYTINMLCIDDLTAMPVNKNVIPYIFKLRHIAQELSGHNAGLVNMMIGCHDVFGIIKKIRIEPTFYFYKSLPVNPSDRSFAERLFGTDLINTFNKHLAYAEEVGLPTSKVLWCDRNRKGLFDAGVPDKNYLRNLD